MHELQAQRLESREIDHREDATKAIAIAPDETPKEPASRDIHNNVLSNNELSEASDRPKPKVYHTGWRLHALTAGYVCFLWLVSLTSLVF
jgi:hypothetical protein